MTTHIFYISGLHCSSCVLLTESKLTDLPYITKAVTNLSQNTITVTGNFGDKSLTTIAEDLTQILAPHGYIITVDKRGQVCPPSFYQINGHGASFPHLFQVGLTSA